MDAREPLAPARELCREYDMVPEGCTLLCAVSGGADSVCLVHWLYQLRRERPFTLIAAHYNHNLRGEESLRDEDFVRYFLSRHCPEAELILGSGDVAAQAAASKRGVEETARDMRYAFLEQTARSVGAHRIATAHNADDNAETVLLHLIRGSGLQGLTGIAPRREALIRPLLTTPRSAIDDYLHLHRLPHVEDSSNADDTYTRNRVRHHLLPMLEQLNPGFVRRMADTTRLLRQDEEHLTGQAAAFCSAARTTGEGLRVDAAALAALPEALAGRSVRLLLTRLTGGCSDWAAPHIRGVLALCRGDSPSAQRNLPGGFVARRIYGELELTRIPPAPLEERPLPLPGVLELPGGQLSVRPAVYDGSPHTPDSFYLSRAKAAHGLLLRPRRTGDTITRPDRTGVTLKKLMIDEKIPRHTRDQIPVLDCGGRVAAVAGIGPDSAFLPEPGSECWHIRYKTNTVQTHTEKGSL